MSKSGVEVDAECWAFLLNSTFPWIIANDQSVSSVSQSCPTLCNPMVCSTPGFPVHHQLPLFTQTHVHWASDAIQPSHPLLSPSPAFNLSQHQGLYQWVSTSHQVAEVLEFQLQHQSFQWTPRISFRMDWPDLLAVQGTLKSLLQHHSLKDQFFGAQLSSQSNSHIHTWPLEKPQPWLDGPLLAK